MKEPNWSVEWPIDKCETKVPRLYLDGSRLILVCQAQMVLFSQGYPERVVSLSSNGEQVRPFGRGRDGDLFFYETVGDSVSVSYLPEKGTRSVLLQPMIPNSHVRSASFYDIDEGYAWIAQVSTEMSHFENDRGYREVGYRFARDSALLTPLDNARDIRDMGQRIDRERLVPVDGENRPLLFESAQNGETAQCLSHGLSYRRGEQQPTVAFGTIFSTPARIGYKFSTIERAIYLELFSSGRCVIRLWEWTP